MRIHYLQHVPFENPGSILEWAKANRCVVTSTRLDNDEVLPDVNEFDWLVVMGGPMNIDEADQYPWLKAEKELIKAAIKTNKVVIGICLGNQLICRYHRRESRSKYAEEIGWFHISFSEKAKESPLFAFFPDNPVVFHWHGDTFVELRRGECYC